LPDGVQTGAQSEWGDAALLATAGEFPGVGSDADLEPLDRFRFGISSLVGKSLAREPAAADADDSSTPKLAVFLLHPAGPPENLAEHCTRVPMLDQGRAPLVGRVWFVTQVVAHGEWLAPSFDDDDDLFRYVTDDLSLGNVPTAVYDAREAEPELRIYTNGLSDLDVYERLYIAFTRISLTDILGRISAIHATQLVTPGAQHRATRLWSKASLGQAASNAEDVLGGLLAAGLQGAYLTCKVRVEQPQPTGRLDIAIEEPVLGQAGMNRVHAILELKILRGINQRGRPVSARTVRTWVESGVTQAAAYRHDRNALATALCCFDMRPQFTGLQCFAHVVAPAAAAEVSLSVWHLFSSASAYRKHLALTGALSLESSGGQA
jgi:hypothetical protein